MKTKFKSLMTAATVATIAATTLLISSVSVAQDTTSTTSADTTNSPSSRAGLFVEPILTVGNDETSIETSQLPLISDDTSGKSESLGIGARLGFHISEAIFLGADGRYAKTRFSDSFYGNADGNMYNYGPTLGFQAPNLGLRVWGTYVLDGQYNPDAGSEGFDLNFEDAKGWRAGIGFRVAALSLNLEYQEITYDKTDIESVGNFQTNAASDVDLENKGAMLSLSFPIEL